MASEERARERRRRGSERARTIAELRGVRPVPRNRLSRGTVVWARVPYPDDPGDSKMRPAVVVGLEGRTVTLLPVTSSTKDSVRQSAMYVLLRDWAEAGLTRPCLVAKREIAVDVIDVATVAGELSEVDAVRVFGE